MIAALLFFGMFTVYLRTCAPHLAPYRDAGEMASLLSTLSVAHPPGYPLYTLVGRIATLLPLGNIVFRINVFSALCAAGALVFLFLTLRKWMSWVPALVSVLFLGFSNPYWDLATVSEMYALGMLWMSLLLYVTFRLENPLLFAFLMALGLGVRMDMLLLIPLFLAWYWVNGARREFPLMAVAFGLGASVFLYLMVRSRTDPVIDWANPDNLLAVLNSARRKNYSGTLDLLSLSYRPGENFFINLKLYGRHALESFGAWGAILSTAGLFEIFRKERKLGFFLLTIFLVTGPVFLYLANMPPNPHSIAIVEASYLVPDMMIVLFIAFGVSLIVSLHPKAIFATVILVPLLFINATHGAARASKRDNLYARDYVENVFRSLPRNAVAVFHKDVQLFSLWAAQLVDQRRPDVSLVATGLSGSPWYWEMKRRWKTASSPEISLKDASGWPQLKAAIGNRPLSVSYDVEMNESIRVVSKPHGMTLSSSEAPNSPSLLPALCLFRGKYVYGQTPDFFSTDLIGDTARAFHQQGFYLMKNNQLDVAEWFFKRAGSVDPTFARAFSDLAYLKFTRGDVTGAYNLYRTAAQKTDETFRLTTQYKSLPDVVAGCRSEASAVNSQWGAMAERLGRVEEARTLYLRSLSYQENAQAHYNLAVTYWEKDWNQVINHMRRAVELNPQMNEARNYLAKAQAMAAGVK